MRQHNDFENKKTVVLGNRCQRCWKDHFDRKAGSPVQGTRQEGADGGGRYIPCSGNRPVKTWANRAGVDIIAQNEGADPSAVVYDAVAAAKAGIQISC